jgi:hypothetical protein
VFVLLLDKISAEELEKTCGIKKEVEFIEV